MAGQAARRIPSGIGFEKAVARQKRVLDLLLNLKTENDIQERERIIALARMQDTPLPFKLPDAERLKVEQIKEEYTTYYDAMVMLRAESKQAGSAAKIKRERSR